MELSGNVQIKNGRFTVLLRSARFDFKSGVYGSDEPVEVQAGDGTTIVADRAAAVHHGQELTFDGHVRTRIVPQANQPPASRYKKGLTYDVALSGSWMVGGAGCCSILSSGADAAAEKPSDRTLVAIFPGTTSKEPISIDADKLVYYDKEHKAVYSGNVVVIQGDTKMTCSVMTVFLDHAPTPGAAAQQEPSRTAKPLRRRLRRQAPRRGRAGHGHLQDPGRDWGQWQLRQGREQSMADRQCDAQRRRKRHQGRQADLRPEDRPGDGRHRLQVRAGTRTIRPEIEADATETGRRRHKGGRCEAEIELGPCRSFATPEQ